MFARHVRKVHKLIGFVVGIQLLLWMASGLYMTAVPIETVRGNHLIEKPASTPLISQPVMPISSIMAQHQDAVSIALTQRRDTLVYTVNTLTDEITLNAVTGEVLPLLTQEYALQLAESLYTGEGQAVSTMMITELSQAPEVRGRQLPVWQVVFDDQFNTSMYVSADTGDIVAVRSDIWRWFDIFWMLHIMDYDERDNFNNPLVIFMVSLGLFVVISGLLMLANVIKHKGLSGVIR